MQMVTALKKTPAELAGDWAGIVSNIVAAMQPQGVMQVSQEVEREAVVGLPVPKWAEGCPDKREALSWDPSQTVANCTVNGVLTHAVVDTGAYKTIMDVGMAKMLGL